MDNVLDNPMQDFPKHRRWAVVGASNNREKFGNKIYRDLKNAGYEVYAVNPREDNIEGDPCFKSVMDLPSVPEVVNVVVPPTVAHEVVQDCMQAGVKRIWFQPGAENPEAIREAEAAGMTVVYDACIMIQKQAWV